MSVRLVTTSVAAIVMAGSLHAAGPQAPEDSVEVVAPSSAPAPSTPRLVFTLRGGVAATPEYFGSDEYRIAPDFSFRLNYVSLGNERGIGNPDPDAAPRVFSIGPSFRYIGERDSDDFDELDGLDTVDATLEVGISVGYASDRFLAFGQVRRGFGGHEGWVGEAGADILFRPSDDLVLSAGPRLLFGDDTFSDTYFGVTPDEASASLAAYDPDGGLVSAGVELGARYRISDVWGIEGAVTWDKYINDAEDSPIVRQGSDESWGARIGITRVFSFR